jgi:predicted metal-dependent hydrolase
MRKQNHMRSCNITVGGLPIEIKRNKGQKNIYIRVGSPEGNVKVSAPERVKNDEIERLVSEKLEEIRKIREKVLKRKELKKREYVSNELCYLWGKPYRLQVVFEGKKSSVSKTSTEIIITAPEGADESAREKLLLSFYREELKLALKKLLPECERKTGVRANEARIKNMKTRWGSCNIKERRIWVSLKLAEKPIECLEYVIIHELTHLLEKSHNRRFYTLLEGFYPKWKETKKLLSHHT